MKKARSQAGSVSMSRSTRVGRRQAGPRALVEERGQDRARLVAQVAARAAVQDEVGEGSVVHLATDCRRGRARPAGARRSARVRWSRAPVAQWTERGRPKACVGGSSPSGGASFLKADRLTLIMPRDVEFWLRVALGSIGLVVAGLILATTPRGYYLDLPSVLLVGASFYVLTSAFIPALRWPRR